MNASSASVRATASVVLIRSQLDELRRANSIVTEGELAAIIGVNPATLYRLSKGDPVSGAFIARVKLAFPHASLDSLFKAVTTERSAS